MYSARYAEAVAFFTDCVNLHRDGGTSPLPPGTSAASAPGC